MKTPNDIPVMNGFN